MEASPAKMNAGVKMRIRLESAGCGVQGAGGPGRAEGSAPRPAQGRRLGSAGGVGKKS